jgi:uncharacterized protein CbrC (UPF0167 family)
MSDDQPFFRFYPGAYQKDGPFEASTDLCEICSRPCVWKYTGGVYGKDISTVCARCIASGDLCSSGGGDDYGLHDIQINGAEPDLEAEILQRTPEVASFNPFEWPVLGGKPLAFAGYADDQILLAIPAVRSAIAEAFREVGETFDGPTSYAIIFKEIDGERYRAVIDVD